MKTRLWPLLTVLIALLNTTQSKAAPLAGAIDFANGGNISIGAKFVAPNISPTDNLLNDFASSDFLYFELDEGVPVIGTSSLLGGPSGIVFQLTSDGVFTFTAGSNPANVDSFVLTLTDLLPSNGDIVGGFDFVSATGSFEEFEYGYPIFTFDSVQGIATFTFEGTGNFILNNSSFSGVFRGASVVPEPATTALGLAGIAGLFVALRRKRQNA